MLAVRRIGRRSDAGEAKTGFVVDHFRRDSEGRPEGPASAEGVGICDIVEPEIGPRRRVCDALCCCISLSEDQGLKQRANLGR